MTEGSVVIVTGKMDDRVRRAADGLVFGTVINVIGQSLWVLLDSGDIWYGKTYEVCLPQTQ
jgi:hypothetical protein